jgi:hypothetical protein
MAEPNLKPTNHIFTLRGGHPDNRILEGNLGLCTYLPRPLYITRETIAAPSRIGFSLRHRPTQTIMIRERSLSEQGSSQKDRYSNPEDGRLETTVSRQFMRE